MACDLWKSLVWRGEHEILMGELALLIITGAILTLRSGSRSNHDGSGFEKQVRNGKKIKIVERCVRLRLNVGQLCVDSSFLIASAIGLIVAGTSELIVGIIAVIVVSPPGLGFDV
ncbi:hypothetical protein PENTCL1PPCAC_16508 [Pristionchus entomophagus]|uniref:Uncharacterized protein n=1 Tax=Pristionchus entomophagus TaxID=358040 RepID=A0AAV5TIX5_9BILA|nr:hypothetical protein PENTCL1PPCAC_16508 [Pristionchus entomophagus]